jgi:hypothetical protein
MMKSRNVSYPIRTVTDTFNKFTHTHTISVSSIMGITDKFTVLSDYTGAKDTSLFHPHQFQKQSTQLYVGTKGLDSTGQTVQTEGFVANFNNLFPNGEDYTQVLNQALSDLYEQLRSAGTGSGLNIAVDIAEGHQVKKMVSDAMALVKHILSFRKPSNWIRAFNESRGAARKFMTNPRYWANQWLAYRYGWAPLANTLYGSFDALMHRRTYSIVRITGKGYSRSTERKSFPDWLFVGSKELVRIDRRTRAKVVCEFELSNNLKQQVLGYTSLNPVVIAWELVPFSFVVDWFYDIGGYLETLESAASFGQNFKRGFYVTGRRWDQDGQLYGSGVSGTTTQWVDASSYWRDSSKNRYVLSAYPLPRKPQFKVNLGSQRLFSAASLLTQFFGLSRARHGYQNSKLDDLFPSRSGW